VKKKTKAISISKKQREKKALGRGPDSALDFGARLRTAGGGQFSTGPLGKARCIEFCKSRDIIVPAGEPGGNQKESNSRSSTQEGFRGPDPAVSGGGRGVNGFEIKTNRLSLTNFYPGSGGHIRTGNLENKARGKGLWGIRAKAHSLSF